MRTRQGRWHERVATAGGRGGAVVRLLLLASIVACSGGSTDPARTFVLQALTDTAQVGLPGGLAPVTPRVQVLGDRVPVVGYRVTFVASGGGSPTNPSVFTDATGAASPGAWTLGTTAGAQTLTASIPGASVVFRATARP